MKTFVFFVICFVFYNQLSYGSWGGEANAVIYLTEEELQTLVDGQSIYPVKSWWEYAKDGSMTSFITEHYAIHPPLKRIEEGIIRKKRLIEDIQFEIDLMELWTENLDYRKNLK